MWSVIYNITSPHWSRKNVIYVFRVEVVLFPIQDKIVSVDPQVCCNSSAEKHKCEDIAVLVGANVVSR